MACAAGNVLLAVWGTVLVQGLALCSEDRHVTDVLVSGGGEPRLLHGFRTEYAIPATDHDPISY
jgi:hypothetical protein